MDSTLLRELHEIELETMKVFHELCVKNHLSYTLFGGTLLGAARHQGFIPWDDDLDVCMEYSDFKRFLKIAKKELPSRFFLQNYHTEHAYNNIWTKLRVNNTCTLIPTLKKLHIHHGVSMDIFYYCGVPDTKIGNWIHRFSAYIISYLIQKDIVIAKNDKISWKTKLVYKVLPDVFRICLIAIFERIICSVGKSSEKVYRISDILKSPEKRKNFIIPRDWIKPNMLMTLPFEGLELYASSKYEQMLEKQYGDWRKLPPVEEQIGHGNMIVDLHKPSDYFLE